MNKNVLIVLGGAVVVAVLVAVLVQLLLGGQEQPAPPPQANVNILVAAKDLKLGAELAPGDLQWQEWPEASLFPGAVKQAEGLAAGDALKGRLGRDITAGEPVVRSALLAEGKGNFVAASLEPGMRAIAIEVQASGMVAGFVGPGDYVDIILTYRESIKTNDDDPRVKNMIQKNLNKLATETILQNVKVLAVDQRAQRGEEDNVKVGRTVTLALSARDTERLALAAELGDLSLALRGVGDDTVIEKSWPTISDARLTNMGDEIFEEYEKMKKDTSINPNIVRIYSGNSVQLVPTK